MGRHTRSPQHRREYGRIVTTFTGEQPTIAAVEQVIKDYRRSMKAMELNPDDYTMFATLTVGGPFNSWQVYRHLGWYLDLDRYDREVQF